MGDLLTPYTLPSWIAKASISSQTWRSKVVQLSVKTNHILKELTFVYHQQSENISRVKTNHILKKNCLSSAEIFISNFLNHRDLVGGKFCFADDDFENYQSWFHISSATIPSLIFQLSSAKFLIQNIIRSTGCTNFDCSCLNKRLATSMYKRQWSTALAVIYQPYS